MAGIVVQHEGGAAVDDAVHEHLDEAARQPVVVEIARHRIGAVKFRKLHVRLEVEGHLDPGGEPAFLLQPAQKLKRVAVAVHVDDRGDAVLRGMGEAARGLGAVDGLFRRRGPGRRFAAGGDAEVEPGFAAESDDGREGLELPQFTGGEAVRAHHHLMPVRHGGPVEDAGGFECLGVGPDGVVVAAHHGDWAVGDDPVEVVAGHRVVVHRVMTALRHQERAVGVPRCEVAEGAGQGGLAVDAVKLQMGEFRAAEDQVQVAFDEAGQERGALAVDHLGRGTGKLLDPGLRAEGGDPGSQNALFQAGRRALIQAEGADEFQKLPPEKYGAWQILNVVFTTEKGVDFSS